ncbi:MULTISPECIES: hypothetical protein [Pseudomonas]|uniref:hypothetical protein n=1 Tax=Pseudomonas TaxID=286 RepID=UPI0007DD1C76|nr:MULTISPECIES: hypothetical protein [Pseudomonas]ANI04228.1 hypothetical protein A210_16745 [Pseudomonas putida SJTE-1]EKT4555645.1 hypothetical protein [Pseudomonas putida]WNI06458.1 hypothetical protein RIF00_18080 [Pseudomonas putida]
MDMYDWVAVGALVLMGGILLTLLVQYLRLQEIWQTVGKCRESMRWARICESENRELKRSLRVQQRLNAHLLQRMRALQGTAPRLPSKLR